MIRAVFFDAAETLIHLPKGVGWHYRTVAAAHGVDVDETRLNAAFRTVFRAAPARLAGEGARQDDDKGWWRALVQSVFGECAPPLSPARFAALFEDLYAHFAAPGVWEVYPDVVPALEELRSAGCRLGVISNFDRRLYSVLAHAGLSSYFEITALSSEVGADKPDPRIFAWALTRLGLPPHEALHAGDHPRHDWQGAEAAGLHVFRLRRPENSLRDLQPQVISLSGR